MGKGRLMGGVDGGRRDGRMGGGRKEGGKGGREEYRGSIVLRGISTAVENSFGGLCLRS